MNTQMQGRHAVLNPNGTQLVLFTNTRILRQTFICALFSSTLKAALTDGLEGCTAVAVVILSVDKMVLITRQHVLINF